MRNREVDIRNLAPTPKTQGGHVPGVPVPNGALISDDNDDSLISVDTESEGDSGGNNADDDGGPEVNIPMRELKALTSPLMVKVVAGLLELVSV